MRGDAILADGSYGSDEGAKIGLRWVKAVVVNKDVAFCYATFLNSSG